MKKIIKLAFTASALGLLCLTACSARTPSPSAPPPRSSTTLGAVPGDGYEQAAVDAVLSATQAPAAAVVLSLENQPHLLALGRHLGADPITQPLRPGSTVKPITAWLAAEAGVHHAGDIIGCPHAFEGAEGVHCFAPHGPLDLTGAIKVSCNTYFMELGARLGLAKLHEGFGRFSLGRKTGLAAGESGGFVADASWVAAHADAPMKRWELLVSAGHGPIQVTLLELAAGYAKLAHELGQPSGGVPAAVLAEIRRGLSAVVADPDGTGHRAFVPGLEIWGKTGSAEQGDFVVGKEPTGEDNGWFVGYCPVEKTLVAVLVLGAGGGGSTAAPLAGRIFESISAARTRTAVVRLP